MPIATIPLAVTPNQRGPIITSSSAPTKDARMVRCFTSVVPNPITGTKEAFVEKIPGWAVLSTPSPGNNATALTQTKGGSTVAAFGSTTSEIGPGAGSVSSNTLVHAFSHGSFNDENYIMFMAGNDGWYFSDTASSASATFTGDFTSGNANITNVSSLTGLLVGQALSTVGAQVAAGARISSITAPSTVTMTANAGANGTGTTVTREVIAKIIDASFSSLSPFGGFVEMDGYVFIACAQTAIANNGVAHSALNDVSSWDTANIITCNAVTDFPAGIVKYRDLIVYFGTESIQFFKNTGNPSGSVLSQIDELSVVGLGAPRTSGWTPVIDLAGSLYWVGLSNRTVDGVYRMNGLTPEKISPNSVTSHLAAVIRSHGSTTSPFILDGFSLAGRNFLYVGNGDIGYLYCVETNQWSEAGFFSGGMRVFGSLQSGSANPRLVGVRLTGETGKLYVMDKSNLTYQDDSAAYTMTIQTTGLALNRGNPFIINNIELLADTQSAGTATLSSSGDDFGSFQTLGTFDMSVQRKRIYGCGRYENTVSLKLEHSHNSAFRGQAYRISWSPCS